MASSSVRLIGRIGGIIGGIFLGIFFSGLFVAFVAALYFLIKLVIKLVVALYFWIMPAKINGLYGVGLGKLYTDSNLPSQVPTWVIGGKRDPYEAIVVSKLKKTGRVYEIEAIPRKDLQAMLSLVKEKYGIEPKIKQFSDTKEDYYSFYEPNLRFERAILLWQRTTGEVRIRATDYDLKGLVEKEKRELELDAL